MMMIFIIKVVDDYKNANQNQQIVIIRNNQQSIQMKSQSNIPPQCLFCHRMTLEKKHLFYILLKKLSKQLASLSLKQENAMNENQSNSFRQLLRIVFGREASDYESICHHKKYYTYCLQKLKCTEKDLNYLSQKYAQTIAEKNYHLYLLSNQIKNSAESIAEGRVVVEHKSDQTTLYSKKGEKIRNKKKGKSQGNSQTEIKVELEVNDEANQFVQQEGGMVNSLSYIPFFNSQMMLQPCPTSITLNNFNSLGYYYPYQLYYSHNDQ